MGSGKFVIWQKPADKIKHVAMKVKTPSGNHRENITNKIRDKRCSVYLEDGKIRTERVELLDWTGAFREESR